MVLDHPVLPQPITEFYLCLANTLTRCLIFFHITIGNVGQNKFAILSVFIPLIQVNSIFVHLAPIFSYSSGTHKGLS